MIVGEIRGQETSQMALAEDDHVVQTFAPKRADQSALFLPLADARVVGVDIEDIAKAGFVLLTTPGHEGKIYSITGPEALTMTEVAEQISQAIGKTVQYVPVSRAQRKQALLGVGIAPYMVDALDVQVGERLKGGIESVDAA
jgi:uncharacterized protein YbjT (DUF2867 family)